MSLELIEAARLLGFKPENGWPETFTNYGMAALQSWRKGMERKDWNQEAATWRKLIELALASGAIEHTTTTERVKVSPPIRRIVNPGFGSSEWTGRGFAGAQLENRSFLGGTLATAVTQPGQSKEVMRHHITASAFAAWLAAKSMEPSPHIAAWFKAQGVGTVPAGETNQERNARWLLIWDTLSPTHEAGSQARAIAAIVAAEGVTQGKAKRGLQDANKARAESYRAGGVHPIKQGKNTANDPFNTVKKRSSKSR